MDFRKECEDWGIKKFGSEAWRKMVEQVRKICEEYNLASFAEELLSHGLHELFNEDGTMIESAMALEIEKGKKWAFGDKGKEATWAAYAGD